jgi:hypothetical protein
MDERVARIRLIPQHHGTGEHQGIYADIARDAYVPHLAPDYAYIYEPEFYSEAHFREVYAVASESTQSFTDVSAANLAHVIETDPRTLLVFRTITGLLKAEFAHATGLVAARMHTTRGLSAGKIDSMEKAGSRTTSEQAGLCARTLTEIMTGELFGDPPGDDVKTKQNKPDSAQGWSSAAHFAGHGVPYSTFLHQRHYGGSFRQVLDATSTERGNIIEEAVEALFTEHGVQFIRTGAHNQADIEAQFGIVVAPAPDFVVYDSSGLRAMMECKGANDGGTARDKALRFERLREEAKRLGGVPLIAVLGGLGWQRVNDTLGPVVRDTDGRVFTLSNLPSLLDVAPFPSLVAT